MNSKDVFKVFWKGFTYSYDRVIYFDLSQYPKDLQA